MALPLAPLGVVIAAFGAVVTVYGYRRRSYHRAIAETPTTDVRQIDEPGLVELSGEVVAADEVGDTDGDATPFEAPLSGATETVVAGWRVKEWSETGDYSRWKTLADGVDAVPFYLDDGTDRVRVDVGSHAARGGLLGRVRDLGELQDSIGVDGITVDFRNMPIVREVGAEEETPPDVREFVETEQTVRRQTGSITNVIDVGNAHGDRKYQEATIRVGDEVYLLGTARPQGDDGSLGRLHPRDAVVAPDPDSDAPFVLSERSEEQLIGATQSSRYVLGLGALVVVVGVAMVVTGLVPALGV